MSRVAGDYRDRQVSLTPSYPIASRRIQQVTVQLGIGSLRCPHFPLYSAVAWRLSDFRLIVRITGMDPSIALLTVPDLATPSSTLRAFRALQALQTANFQRPLLSTQFFALPVAGEVRHQ